MDTIFDLNTLDRWLHVTFKKGQVVSSSASALSATAPSTLPRYTDEKVKHVRRDVLIIDGEYRYETFAVTEEDSKVSDMDTVTFSGQFDMAIDGGSTDGRSEKTCTAEAESRKRSN
ncbi:hypothetical protein OCU04_010792 [Sclerotinia nivalis]|uniref:Uncharacterized protein n=1 Tax=Sclerotinia nivalis TaxID=352851 RepID=A0A9X0DF26_9HELO|nr:hypothetical protein OCU04_010792 [Sclerotinia nivalis]